MVLLVFKFDAPCSQVNKKSSDITPSINESVINEFFMAVGAVSGTNEYENGLLKDTCSRTMRLAWTLLIKDSARYVTDVSAKAGTVRYATRVLGKVAVKHLEKTNKIRLLVVDAVFGTNTNLLGKKIYLKNLQLADYFDEPFCSMA